MTRAAAEGISFGRRASQLLRQQEHLNLLDSIVAADEWDDRTIEERSENLLALAWDRFSPWLLDR